MKHFASQREAKEFLVGEIVREAEREGRPLPEIERKMLYFSEVDWTLPDMFDVAEKFDQEYDSAAYESKIAALARAARRAPGTDKAMWSEAIARLEEGDHYLLVLIGVAGGPRAMTWRSAVAVVAIIVGAAAGWPVLSEYFTKDEVGFLIWAAVAAVVAGPSAIRLFRARRRMS